MTQEESRDIALRTASPSATLALLDLLPQPCFILVEKLVLHANPAFHHLIGETQRLLTGTTCWQYFEPQLVDRLTAANAIGQPLKGRLTTVKGEEKWLEFALGALPLEGMPAVLVQCTDKTDAYKAEVAHSRLRQLLSQIIDGDPVPTFVVNDRHIVTHWNKARELVTGMKASDIVGTRQAWRAFYTEERPTMADLIVDNDIDRLVADLYREKRVHRSALVNDAYEAEDFFPHFGESGRWLFFTAAPLRSPKGRIIGAIETLQDVTPRKVAEAALHEAHDKLEHLVTVRTQQLAQAKELLEDDIHRREGIEAELRNRNNELLALNDALTSTKEQLANQEKMASIGQLAAGVAHEINNPIGYVYSNLNALGDYLDDLLGLVELYEEAEKDIQNDTTRTQINQKKRKINLKFLKDDLHELLKESSFGITCVRKIVQDLKDFSRSDDKSEWQMSDIHAGIESAINISTNEVKYKAEILREFGEIPQIECQPSRLNQVIMNLLVNSAQAMPEGHKGKIWIRTGTEGGSVWIEVEDNGSGIPQEIINKIFDPFFTTKPIGKGTGLGLSLSYGIVHEHGGEMVVRSQPGQGTCFRITLPVRHPVNLPAGQ